MLPGVKIANGRFVATIKFNKKTLHIGVFDTEEEANKAFEDKKQELRFTPNLKHKSTRIPNDNLKGTPWYGL